MATAGLNMISDFSAQQADIERQRRMAELLQQQSMAPMETNQTAGGFVVPVSPYAGLAKALQGYTGIMGQRSANDREKALAQALAGERSSVFQKAQQAAMGTPETTAGSNEPGDAPVTTPAVPGSQQAAYAALAASRDPTQSAAGQAAWLKALEPVKLREGEQLQGPGGNVLNRNDRPVNLHFGNTGTGIQGMHPQTGAPVGPALPVQAPLHFANTGTGITPLNAMTGAPAGPVTPVTPQPDDLTRALVNAGIDPKSPAAQAIFKQQAAKLVSHAPAPSQTVINAGPRAFEGELGKLDAQQLGTYREQAQSAQQTLGIVDNLRGAVNQGVYSGGAAQAKTAVANMINGITGFTPRGLPGSQVFDAEASKLVLEKVKTLGANPSNADRIFIEKTVPMLSTSPEARDQMIRFLETKAKQSIDLYQRADTHARKNHGLGGFNAIGTQPGGAVIDFNSLPK